MQKSFFNDTYSISSTTIDETGIAWPSDIEYKFGRPSSSSSIQWTDPTNEHFIVWMRTAGMPNFRKLWGRIHAGLAAGTYTLTITNNYDVSAFDGKKRFVLSTTNAFGGKNTFLGICYIVVGSLWFIFAIIFMIAWFIQNRKKKEE